MQFNLFILDSFHSTLEFTSVSFSQQMLSMSQRREIDRDDGSSQLTRLPNGSSHGPTLEWRVFPDFRHVPPAHYDSVDNDHNQ